MTNQITTNQNTVKAVYTKTAIKNYNEKNSLYGYLLVYKMLSFPIDNYGDILEDEGEVITLNEWYQNLTEALENFNKYAPYSEEIYIYLVWGKPYAEYRQDLILKG